ncbi:MAG: GNAT family N-acetyltransferase [Maribacter sp.]
MEEKVTIRKAMPSDLDILLQLEQGVIAAERPFDPTIRENPVSYYDLKSMLINPKALILVATKDNVIVSCGYALEKDARPYLNHKTYAYLGFMFTLPAFRGRGINAMIISELQEWASQNGLKEVRLTVYNNNEPALRAYEKVGFQRHIIEMRLVRKE